MAKKKGKDEKVVVDAPTDGGDQDPLAEAKADQAPPEVPGDQVPPEAPPEDDPPAAPVIKGEAVERMVQRGLLWESCRKGFRVIESGETTAEKIASRQKLTNKRVMLYLVEIADPKGPFYELADGSGFVRVKDLT